MPFKQGFFTSCVHRRGVESPDPSTKDAPIQYALCCLRLKAPPFGVRCMMHGRSGSSLRTSKCRKRHAAVLFSVLWLNSDAAVDRCPQQ